MFRENNCFKMYGGISGPLDPPMIHQALCCLCLILLVLSVISQSGSYRGGGGVHSNMFRENNCF